MSVEIGPKACIFVARGQTWQGYASCLKKTQLVAYVSKGVLHRKYFFGRLVITEIKNNVVFKMQVRIN